MCGGSNVCSHHFWLSNKIVIKLNNNLSFFYFNIIDKNIL